MRTPKAATRILLVGTGRMAYNLGPALLQAGFEVVGVAGRNAEARKDLGRYLGRPAFAIGKALPPADLVLLAVSDDAIAGVAARIAPGDGVVAHTAGAKGLDELAPHRHRGILWPIQTLGHGAPMDLHQVPMVVDANDATARRTMLTVARRLSESVYELPMEDRQRVHLAAVLTSNFPVFLVQEAQRLLRARKLPPGLLTPLWKATAARVTTLGPERAMTGPASRGDRRTIGRHLELLAGEPDLQRLYALLSEGILGTHGHAR